MFSAKITFGIADPSEEALDLVHDLFSVWYKNGQIVRDGWPLVSVGGHLEVHVSLPERDSLATTRNNSYGVSALAQLQSQFGLHPKVELLGEDLSLPDSCACVASSQLVFFTDYLSATSPVRCLDCFAPVPLYRLPHVHDEEHLVILQWAADYRSCDTLQMHSTTGERFGEAQLGAHDSSLSRNGRSLAATLERLTGKPVYYYLHKTRSRGRKAELSRICPSCGAAWLLETRLHHFDFLCKDCRLASAIAADA
jgi:predicted  nucleic acid-binding Zn ribbon protein